MKKSLLLLISAFTLTVSAQVSIQITENANPVAVNGTINAVTTANNNTKTFLDIKNVGATTHSYIAKRYDILLHSALSTTADAYFCFAGACYTSGTFSAGTLILNPGQTASSLPGQFNMLVADLDEAPTAGLSIVKYSFRNINTPADSVQITIAYNQPAGIQDNRSIVSSFELSPNPVDDNATIKINSTRSGDAKFYIYNSLGMVVSEKAFTLTEGKNKLDLNTESLASGIYFANLKIGGSTVTKKFIVK